VIERLRRLAATLEEPLLVTSPVNVRYLTGFDSSNPALLVDPEAKARLYSDFRYAQAARAVEDVDFFETKRALLRDLADALEGRIGFEADSLPYAGYETLASSGRLDLVPRSRLVESLRAVKDEHELAALRRACAVTDRVYARLAEEKFIGRSESELAWRVEELFHEEGAERAAFDVIVAAGPNASKPHAVASKRVIEAGETVVVDAGCVVEGYVSDYTRTFSTGPLAAELEEAYAVCLEAQQAALAGLRAGLTGIDGDRLARDVIEGSRFAGTFGHGLGHGIGLDVHEAPRLSTESSDTLVSGNVVTVEPGIYLEGRGGIRIEDDVVIADGGAENLSRFTKELLTVE
jgi:Xaa-Pro aminopeptidase